MAYRGMTFYDELFQRKSFTIDGYYIAVCHATHDIKGILPIPQGDKADNHGLTMAYTGSII